MRGIRPGLVLPAIAAVLLAAQARGEEAACDSATAQGAVLLSLAAAVPGAIESGRLSPQARAGLRADLTAAYLAHRASADGRPLCQALDRLRDAHGLRGDPGAGPASPVTAVSVARCMDAEQAGRIWNDMLPDIDAAHRLGFLAEDEYGAFSLYFTAINAAVAESPAISMPEVCLSFLGLWRIYRS